MSHFFWEEWKRKNVFDILFFSSFLESHVIQKASIDRNVKLKRMQNIHIKRTFLDEFCSKFLYVVDKNSTEQRIDV